MGPSRNRLDWFLFDDGVLGDPASPNSISKNEYKLVE
jgi:hypothetical protein